MTGGRPLIIGAGPAGIRAAQALVAAGLRPLVVDEAPACGGQIYRQPLVADGRPPEALYGSEADKATGLHRAFAELAGHIDHWPQALVWNLREGVADIAVAGASRSVAYDGLILATGATDRILPVPGWTLPGVFTLGGAQIALKSQGCAIGRRVVFAGTGPLLYLVAWQYLKAGADVAAVLDAAPLVTKLHMLRALLTFPHLVLRGMGFMAALHRAGVAIHHGISDLAFEGEHRLSGVRFSTGCGAHHIACDGVGYGLALRPETQLADLAGCAFRFDARDRAWLPERTPAGRSSRPGVYLSGDGAGIAGADAAELAGERAALALCTDRGLPVDGAREAQLERELARIGRFRTVLERAFPFPTHWASALEDDTTLCRCEEITVGEVRTAAEQFHVREINRLKAVSRVGMGRCQGRMCGPAAAEVLAACAIADIDAIGRLRAQAPIKPLPLTLPPDAREAAE